MRIASWCLAGVMVGSGIVGCGQASTPDDTGMESPDGGPDRPDAFVPPGVDTGVPPSDAGADAPSVPLDAGTDAAAPIACPTPGASENVACGMCGSVTRFCSADHTWAYGTCTGETGVCVPGTTQTIACGDCGTQPANCDATCHWAPSAACSGEGTCAPGTRTRVTTGCPSGQTQEVVCDAMCAFQPSGTCTADACTTPGAMENVACGMCGTVSRFCDASHTWEYGTCGGEPAGACAPGTTGMLACGHCGMQPAHCDTTCHYVAAGACTGEGVCAPGTTTITATGCPAGQMHQVQCDATCAYGTELTPCATSRPVDVTFVLDITGSNSTNLANAISPIETSCIMPLLALTGVSVGISFTGEYPATCCGETTNHPFLGGIEPTTDYAMIMATINARASMSGGDLYDGTLAPLSMLSGGPVEYASTPVTCSAGRVAGGCWRSGAARVVVIHTDSPIHGGPLATGTGIDMPYTGVTFTPTPATWTTVLPQMTSQAIQLVWFDTATTGAGDAATPQFTRMLNDLGQPATNLHATIGTAAVTTACGQLVAQVRTMAGL